MIQDLSKGSPCKEISGKAGHELSHTGIVF